MASLVPDFSGIQANTSSALRNLLDANRAVTESYMAPVDRLERYAKEAEAKRILDEDRALKLEDRLYSRARDERNDKIAQEDRDYLLGQRKNKEDFMKSISEPGVDALDDTILKRTNDLVASKWNEANPISDADAAKLNDYYVKNQKILNPTLDPENLRSYIGSQALKYGIDPSTATSTYEMFKPDKKETGLTDMEKLLIQNELGMQRDVNKLNAEKALGNEKYDGKSGISGAKKDKAGAIGSDFASNAAELNKLELDTDVIDAFGATPEKEKALNLYTELSKTYNPKDVANVIKASISNGGEINNDTLKSLLTNIPANVSKSDASSTTGALEKVEYKPSIDLQSMIAKSTKVDKGQLAEDMFEREFGIPKGKSGVSYSRPTSGAIDNYVPKSLPKEYESAYSSLIGKEGTDTKGKYVGYGQFEEKTATPYLQQLGKTWSDFKSDPYLQKEITAMHMVDNAERLKKNDIEPNDTNLYMVHNLGEPTALKVLKGKTLDTSDYHKILNQLSNKEIGVELPRFANTAENKEKGVVGQIDITKAKAMVKTGELPAFDNIDASALWMNKFGKKDDYIENVSKEPFDVSKKDTKEQAIVDRFQEINKLYGKDSQKAIEEKAKAKEDINRTFKLRDLMNSTSKAPNKIDEVLSGEKVDKDRILENYSSAKLIQDSGTNQYGAKEWVTSNIDTGRYVDIADKAKGYSSKIANVATRLREDGFKDTNSILELISYMPEGKDKDAVANVYHYKMMQSNSEDGEAYRKAIADKQLSDAGWLAANVITSAVPIGAAFKGASVLKNAASTKAAKTATSKAQAELAEQATKRKLDDAMQSKLNLEKRLDELSLKKNTKDVANETRKLESEWKRVQDYINNLK